MVAPVLVLGASGQVGSHLLSLLKDRGVALVRPQIDFLDPDFTAKLDTWLDGRKLRAVINAAAHVNVDQAESERDVVMRVNAEAVGALAAWCKKHDMPLVHYSTDYVFDGASAPYREEDKTHPLNVYGESKLAGEEAIEAAGGDYLILRTSLIYDAEHANIFTNLLQQMREKTVVDAVSDMVSAPTYAQQLAQATLLALEHALDMARFPSGVYHLCHGGEASRYEFASAIFALARSLDSSQGSPIICRQINPIASADFPRPARRPLHSTLDCTRAREVLGVALPHWQNGLEACFDVYASSRRPTERTQSHSA